MYHNLRKFVFSVLTKYPPGDRYCYRTRFRSGRNAAVHRSAKDALQVPALLYGAYTIPVSRLLSFHPEKRISNGRNKAGSFSTKIPFLSISRKDSVNNCCAIDRYDEAPISSGLYEDLSYWLMDEKAQKSRQIQPI